MHVRYLRINWARCVIAVDLPEVVCVTLPEMVTTNMHANCTCTQVEVRILMNDSCKSRCNVKVAATANINVATPQTQGELYLYK